MLKQIQGRSSIADSRPCYLDFRLILWNTDIVHGIDGGAVIVEGEVEVRAVCPAGQTYIADDLPLVHILSFADGIVGHMAIKGGIAV